MKTEGTSLTRWGRLKDGTYDVQSEDGVQTRKAFREKLHLGRVSTIEMLVDMVWVMNHHGEKEILVDGWRN